MQVRAAMPGMPVSEQNCHPFQWGRYLFMHNGAVGGFMRIRRALLATLSNAAYDTVQVTPACSVCTALSHALGAAWSLNGLVFCAVVSLGLRNMLQHFHAPPAQPDDAADAAVTAAGHGGALLRSSLGLLCDSNSSLKARPRRRLSTPSLRPRRGRRGDRNLALELCRV